MRDSEAILVSRRRFVAAGSIALAAALVSPRKMLASFDGLVEAMMREAKTAKIVVHPVRRNISVLEGSGGNITVLTGPDGKLLVDAGIVGSQTQITAALAALSADPIKHLINTHWHFDHTGGNVWLHTAGATIIAHENTRKHMRITTRVEPWKYTFPPTPAAGIPEHVVQGDHQLHLNDTSIRAHYFGSAHTDGDLSVYFAEADVLSAGDTFWNGYFPFIDYAAGGSIDGMIKATETNLAASSAKTILIPGHGPLSNKAELTEFRDMLVDIRTRVADLKKQGQSLADVVAAKPTAAYDAKWGNFAVAPPDFTTLVYAGV